jgi:hypothetical protein
VFSAAGLAALSVGVMAGRSYVLGEEINGPAGAGTWKVSLLVHGKITSADARLQTAVPLDFGRQHIEHERYRSAELFPKPPDAKYPERRHVAWTPRAGAGEGPFEAHYEFRCTVNTHATTSPMSKMAQTLYAAPPPGEELHSEPRIQADDPAITALAERLVGRNNDAPRMSRRDQLTALYRYVEQEIGNEPTLHRPGVTAVDCLRNGSGDAAAKSRLLAALCRNRGIPARPVVGVALKHGHEQNAHTWVEAWVADHWLPMCPLYHHLGRVPSTYLVFAYGDSPLVHGRGVRELSHAFLVERPSMEGDTSDASGTSLRRILARLTLYSLPPAEQRLVEFLLLLPLAALIVCVYRNLIGLASFGTFAPALVGLAFRELGGLPGILVFVSIVLIGWLMRRVLDYYHLLQVPRMALLLSLVVFLLITAIVSANFEEMPATRYISLFPMVILTGMIERFWTLESEDGTVASFRTLLGTMIIATTISLVLSLHGVVRQMIRFPEIIGLIMAAQLLLGRYTGYRLSELFRFRELATDEY